MNPDAGGCRQAVRAVTGCLLVMGMGLVYGPRIG